MNLTKFIWRSLELLLTSQSSLPCCGLGLLALLPEGGLLRRPVTPGRVLADRWACCRSGVVWVEAVEGADLAPFHLWTSLSACSATAYKTQRTSLPLHLLSVQWISTKFTFVFIHFYFTDKKYKNSQPRPNQNATTAGQLNVRLWHINYIWSYSWQPFEFLSCWA